MKNPTRNTRTAQTTAALKKEQSRLLSSKISALPLTIKGTRLEPLVAQLRRELEDAGISFKPNVYLSDEWGCPSRVPLIGVPFYLVDPALCEMERQMTGIEAETDSEILMYLRHEAGHAFNYAYRLCSKPAWRVTFGRFSEPYREDYKPVPFSTRFVRHVPAWYAQKHPDDDFAETFAVWLDPASAWRKTYAGTTALAKLIYVDNIAKKYGRQPPVVREAQPDQPLENLNYTLDSWYQACRVPYETSLPLPLTIDGDLRSLFPLNSGRLVGSLLRANKFTLVSEVNSWTGVDRHIIAGLLNSLAERIKALALRTGGGKESLAIARLSVFVTTLAMNYLRYDKFVPE